MNPTPSATPNKPSKAVPMALPTTQPYWDAAQRGELHFQRCADCQAAILYPRIRCPSCGSASLGWERASGRATLDSYVISHMAAPGFEAPYVIAIVKLEEGPRLLSNIVGVPPDPDQLTLDMALEVCFEARGDQQVPVFHPAREARA